MGFILQCCETLQVYALKASDFTELLGDRYEAFLEHAQMMYSQKTEKTFATEEASTHLVSYHLESRVIQFISESREPLGRGIH